MKELAEIAKAALALPLDERSVLTHRLAESLRADAGPEVKEAWKKEIERRLAEVRSGAVDLIDGPEGLARVRKTILK